MQRRAVFRCRAALHFAPLDTADLTASPASRPLGHLARSVIEARLARALSSGDGAAAAHCIHEIWMRGEMPMRIERALERLWKSPAAAIPDWLPMRYVEWLPTAYEVALRFRVPGRGRSNIYLALLDYCDRSPQTYGVYVGMSRYSPADRFDQHKAGIRAAGSVLKRGLEVLTGPTLHLQSIPRAAAERIEIELAGALGAAGIIVQGGH